MRRMLTRLTLTATLVVCGFTANAAAQSAASSAQGSPSQSTAVETDTEDAINSKLFFAPTGRSLKRGEAYLALDALFIPVVRVGVTDRFSIGVGRPLLFNTTWVTPKFQIYKDSRTAVATGVLHLFAPGFGVGGVSYGVATIGSSDDAFTAGLGWFYGKDDDGFRMTAPMLIVGGERRMSRRSKFVTENYLFEGGAVMSAGSRLIGHRTSVELGGMLIVSGSGAMPGAVLNVIIHAKR